MNKITEHHIENEYNKIIQEIKNGILYGEKIDLNNIKMIVVAAYFFGTTQSIPYFKNEEIQIENKI